MHTSTSWFCSRFFHFYISKIGFIYIYFITTIKYLYYCVKGAFAPAVPSIWKFIRPDYHIAWSFPSLNSWPKWQLLSGAIPGHLIGNIHSTTWHSCSTFLVIFFCVVFIVNINSIFSFHLISEIIVTFYILDCSFKKTMLIICFNLFIIFPSLLYSQ